MRTLDFVCPRCAESNPEHARFCLNCGAPLAGVGSEERKLVTVLFSDLVASRSAREARVAFERLGARPALAEVDALTQTS